VKQLVSLLHLHVVEVIPPAMEGRKASVVSGYFMYRTTETVKYSITL
jgi:hypothetical protein